ncbi:hypothetical protein BT69DRAFT_1375738, partial [Atractiella rhizophila]
LLPCSSSPRYPSFCEHSFTPVYDRSKVVIRDHRNMREQGLRIDCASVAEAEMSKDTCINWSTIWFRFPGVVFPWSFALDFMHLIFENIIRNLLAFLERRVQRIRSHRKRTLRVQRANVGNDWRRD